ncbi:MAG: hypothetical protein A2474_00875 [Elusimicrobia bacterium RIFOXYC2_FULL_34_12]|nr:MAG: hypothetical protein A2474_00875 [Elusimicrobia bacterium RIFOXYC2_FULL_34_12]OGS38875.1 MAG: hypothetical protein A2551_03365 [Elusimicrobia bacterium RIFOXYD2_FULL_34_30]HAM39053.1 hypothetical protein [Elusimicrobiota bacterium]
MASLIICYHNINKNGIITPKTFEENVRLLISKKYYFATLDEVYNHIIGKKELPEKTVHLTFDDGYSDNYTEAFPILKKYNINATIFLTTSQVGLLGHLDWNMIREMQDSKIISFESHTHSHPRYFLMRPLKEKLAGDILISKNIIKENLKKESKYFCYPYGEYDDLYIDVLKSTGFLCGLTLNIGLNNVNQNPYLLKRIDARGPENWLKKRMVIYSNQFLSRIYEKVYKKI